ncbi:DedA family protein [Streptomyces marincola]|uniref:DedA family protein n=1 Tax=Streptomyces marincola TaxID=2878388 RepID=UPI001CF0EB57|nr:VTT domain-containing protein [Streptomyces marincola]UCM87901.1 VTT domain-containing protein [Streptomyces marincola]
MTDPLDALGQVPPAVAYVLLAVVVLTESILLVGAFVPTLTLLLTAGALSRAGDLNLLLVIAVAACAVVAGDCLGHRTGRVLGERLRAGRLARRVPDAAWQRAEHLMERRGGQAVFVSRFVPVVRTVTPHVAGAARLPYRRIAPYSAVAAVLWAGAEAGAGYAAAPALERVLVFGGPLLAAVLAAGAGIAFVWVRLRRRRRGGPPGRGGAPTPGGPPGGDGPQDQPPSQEPGDAAPHAPSLRISRPEGARHGPTGLPAPVPGRRRGRPGTGPRFRRRCTARRTPRSAEWA